MEVITIYCSDDGKMFDNKGECLEHERELRSNQFKNTVLLFDDQGHQLPLSYAGIEGCTFIVCKTDASAEYLYNEFGTTYYLPWDKRDEKKAGAWISTSDEWENLEDFLPLAKIAIEISGLLE